METPQQCNTRGDLDNAVNAEPDQGDAARRKARRNADQPFQTVIGDGEILKPLTAPDKQGPVHRCCGHSHQSIASTLIQAPGEQWAGGSPGGILKPQADMTALPIASLLIVIM